MRSGYDGADELLAVTKSGTSQSPIDAYAYRYDAAGNRTVEQIDSSVTSSAYNALNQMTSRNGGGLLTVSGSLSEPGTITVGTGQPYITGTISTAFSLTTPVVTGSNSIQISATDANGNGATHFLQVNVTSGTPIPALQYDADGNLTSDGSSNYAYDAASRLVQITYSNGSNTRFAYDGLGRRVSITENGTDGAVTSVRNFIWEGKIIAEARNSSDVLTNWYFPQGVQIGGTKYYYTRDHLGSIREMLDTSETIQIRYDYDPYGRQTQLIGTMSNDLGYTGFYYHQPSKLNLPEYRGYLASLGRWISRDPSKNVEIREGPNVYEYVLNNPTTRIDFYGLGIFGDAFGAVKTLCGCNDCIKIVKEYEQLKLDYYKSSGCEAIMSSDKAESYELAHDPEKLWRCQGMQDFLDRELNPLMDIELNKAGCPSASL